MNQNLCVESLYLNQRNMITATNENLKKYRHRWTALKNYSCKLSNFCTVVIWKHFLYDISTLNICKLIHENIFPLWTCHSIQVASLNLNLCVEFHYLHQRNMITATNENLKKYLHRWTAQNSIFRHERPKREVGALHFYTSSERIARVASCMNHIFLYKFMRTRVGSPFTDIKNAP